MSHCTLGAPNGTAVLLLGYCWRNDAVFTAYTPQLDATRIAVDVIRFVAVASGGPRGERQDQSLAMPDLNIRG